MHVWLRMLFGWWPVQRVLTVPTNLVLLSEPHLQEDCPFDPDAAEQRTLGAEDAEGISEEAFGEYASRVYQYLQVGTIPVGLSIEFGEYARVHQPVPAGGSLRAGGCGLRGGLFSDGCRFGLLHACVRLRHVQPVLSFSCCPLPPPPSPPLLPRWLRTASSRRACTCWASRRHPTRRLSTWQVRVGQEGA